MVNLWEHQRIGVERATTSGFRGFGFFYEMGCGKSGALIRTAATLMNHKHRHMRTLIFTPPLVVPQFKEEFKKFSKIEPKKVVVLNKSGAQRLKTFLKYRDSATCFITNYESMSMKKLFQAFQEWEPEICVFDESQYLKSHSALRSKLAFELANPWDRKERRALPKPHTFLLSGTPILNQGLDIFQQIKVMLGGFPRPEFFTSLGSPRHLVTNYFVFRGIYFVDRNAFMPKDRYFPKWEPKNLQRDGVDGLGEIRRILESISHRVTKADALDLPEEVAVNVPVEMTAEQDRMYQEMRKDLVTYLGDKACAATVAMVKGLRLLQMTSGFVSLQGVGAEEDRADHRFQGTPKDQALKDLLTELTPHSKVLVWAVWRENYGRIREICEDLGIGYVQSHGEATATERRECQEKFNNDPNIRVFIGHPGSGGVGLNLIGKPGTSDRCAYSIFYSRTFKLGEYLQSRARNHRGGQTEKVTHYDLICQGTIEEPVLEKLAGKLEISSTILGDLL